MCWHNCNKATRKPMKRSTNHRYDIKRLTPALSIQLSFASIQTLLITVKEHGVVPDETDRASCTLKLFTIITRNVKVDDSKVHLHVFITYLIYSISILRRVVYSVNISSDFFSVVIGRTHVLQHTQRTTGDRKATTHTILFTADM